MSNGTGLAVVGTGPVALLSANLAATAGHKVAMLSPRDVIEGSHRIRCTGAMEADSTVEFIAHPAGLTRYCTVLVAIPATAYYPVLSALLPHLRSGQTVIFSGALSLAQLWLAERARELGIGLAIATWGTTLGTAQRIAPLHAHVTTVRPALTVTASPIAATEELTALCSDFFGPRFQAADAPMATLLSNINPIAHAGQVIPNLARIDNGEAWSLFANFTSAGANIATAIDAERLAIAEAFGIRLRSLLDHYRLSFGVEGEDLSAVARAIEKAGKTMPGPTSAAHRYIAEDVPFGLVPLKRLGTLAGVATPVLDLTIDLLSCAQGQPYSDMNPILDDLRIGDEPKQALMRRLER